MEKESVVDEATHINVVFSDFLHMGLQKVNVPQFGCSLSVAVLTEPSLTTAQPSQQILQS